MATKNQLTLRKCRKTRIRVSRVKELEGCPQKKGISHRCYDDSPRKPNSGDRPLAKVFLSNKKDVTCYIPGKKEKLNPFSNVLIRGGRTRDMPALYYKLVRGKYDLPGIEGRKNSRSKYGTKLK